MPFGLKNAPATFWRALDVILNGFMWQIFLVYIDNVIIKSHTAEQHIHNVKTILIVLGVNGILLKLAECVLFTGTVRYPGHILRPGTLEVEH